jgi:hypothetical protein
MGTPFCKYRPILDFWDLAFANRMGNARRAPALEKQFRKYSAKESASAF